MHSLLQAARSLLARFTAFVATFWRRYRTLRGWQQIAGLVLVILLIWGIGRLGSSNVSGDATSLPTVTVSTLSALTGNGGTVDVLGSVRSISQADILAESSGEVTNLHAALGSTVSAGFVIGELENSSQRAAVLQAEGSYDAAVAAQAGTSEAIVAASARNTYATAYSTMDTLLKDDLDVFFGTNGAQGPQFLISPAPFDFSYFPIKRQELTDAMTEWHDHLTTANNTDPETLLNEAVTVVQKAVALGNDISKAANNTAGTATATELTDLATARSGFTTLLATITTAKSTYLSQNTSATAGADASVKIALGALRLAQAQLEKTLIRAPISGTINFLPIHVGDYVSALTHVATVAQNGTLEIVSNISESDRALLSVGQKVIVEGSYPAVVTSIAPALSPTTKQIEVHFGITGTTSLVNGQSVRISLPNAVKQSIIQTASTTNAYLLPLTTVKLTPTAREVFSVGEDGRLVGHEVEIGDVRGDKIEIKTALPTNLEIVTDARGFSEGEKVSVATSTP